MKSMGALIGAVGALLGIFISLKTLGWYPFVRSRPVASVGSSVHHMRAADSTAGEHAGAGPSPSAAPPAAPSAAPPAAPSATPSATPSAAPPEIQLSTAKAARGATVTVKGSGFAPAETVELRVGATAVGTARADSAGAFTQNVTIPPSAPPGPSGISATGRSSSKTGRAPFSTA
jgi:hypothetical protein